MKKVLLLVLMAYSWLPMQSESVNYEVKIDGVYYRLNASWDGSIALETRGRAVGDITVPSNSTRRAYVISGTEKYTGNVTIPASVEYEGNTYPVISISAGAFKDCITLQSVSMTNSIESIGNEAFAGCTFLKSIRLPRVIYDFGKKAFAGCTNLESVSLLESSSDARAFLSSSANTRSSSIIFHSNEIGDSVFVNCTKLKKVALPRGIKKMCNRIFENCESLTSVSFRVGNAFASVYIGAEWYLGNGYMGTGLFVGCKNIKDVYIDRPYSNRGISDDTFDETVYNNATLHYEQGSEEAFRKSRGWKNFVHIVGMETGSEPATVKTVDISEAGTLANYISDSEKYTLTELTVTGYLNSTDFKLLRDMAGNNYLGEETAGKLQKLDMNGATIVKGGENYLEAEFVYYTSEYGTSTYENTLAIENDNELGIDVFTGCKLQEVILPSSLTSIAESAFSHCLQLTSVTLPEGLLSIGGSAFSSCEALSILTIPNSVTSIGGWAFSECSGLTSVTIPNSVTSIGDYAFAGCSNLASITSYITSPFEISDASFDTETYETINLIVPHGTKSTYQKTNGWKNFKNIVETGSEPVTVKTVDVAEAGTLANYISDSEKYTLTELTVTGYLNSTDFKLLRDMAGNNYHGEETAGKLLKLDLNGATIVKGGENYLEAQWVYYTSGYGISTSGNTLAIENDNELGKDVFMGCKLQEVILPSSLTSIARSAFSYCLQLTNVTLPEGLLSIGGSAFSSCEALSTLTIPNSVTTLGRYAFAYCNSLTSMTIPDGITTLEDNLFYDCRGLSSVVIPASVTRLKNQVFELCSSLTEVTVYRSAPPSTGYQSFTTQANATLYVPKGSIEAYKAVEPWKNFSKITEIQGISTNDSEYIWETGVNNDWGAYAQPLYSANQDGIYSGFFYAQDADWSGGMGAFKFTGVFNSWDEGNYGTGTINGDGLSGTLIDDGGSGNVLAKPGFYKATVNLAEMTYQLTPITSIGLIGPAQIGGWNKETELTYNPTTRAWEVSIELAADEFKFRANHSWDINWGGSLNNLIQDGSSLEIKKAGKYFIQFFPLCETKSYATITESGSSPEIGSVFEVDGIYFKVGEYNNVSVTSGEVKYFGDVMIPSYVTYNGNTYSVTSIESRAFCYCTGLTSVIIPNSVTFIGDYAFDGCSGLTSVTIPNSVTYIGEYAFLSCSGLPSVTIPNNVTYIGSGVFSYCNNLATITVDAGNTFYNSPDGCNAIIKTASNTLVAGCKNSTIPNSVTSIGRDAFWGCSGLTSVTIPSSVTSIGIGAFANCSNLATITVDAGNTVYNSPDGSNAIIETTSNTLVAGFNNTTIPNSVTSIGYYAFYDCSGLTSVTIPNSVTSIGEYAFLGCSDLTSVTIPNSVTSIGKYAFLYCSGLTSVTSLISNPISLNEYTFSNYNIPLYVPSESVEAYRAMKPWNEFKEIIPLYLTPIEKEVDYSDESSTVDENTDLGGTVIDNVYYNISSDNGGFDADEKCLVVNKAMSDEEIEEVFGKDLFCDEVKENFTGIVIMAPAGKGKVAIDAQTTGGMTLMVKVGAADPLEMELDGKLKMKFPYNVTEPTYVYIYAGKNAAARTRAAEVPSLKIYGISLEMDILKGDANGDGVVNDADVKDVASYIMGMTPTGFNKDAADVNNDNKVNAADIVLINKFLNKK